MRIPNYVSPSALAKFEKDPDDFYLKYMAEPRPEREPQSAPASVGSAFDAYVKSQLSSDLFGKPTFTELFETQVEPHNRDFAREAGEHCFKSYLTSGAYEELLDMMEGAKEEPQFEFKANVEIDGVPLLGKPDARFVSRDGVHVVLDWKVNGYCGKYATSPTPGFKLCRDGYGWPKPSRSHDKPHKLYQSMEFKGLEINSNPLENFSIDWADQLTMYGWMMGELPGDENVVVCIDQLVAKPNGSKPLLRIAQHRGRVSSAYQVKLVERLVAMWEAIQSGWLFRDMTEEASRDFCSRLDSVAAATNDDEIGSLYRGAAQYRVR